MREVTGDQHVACFATQSVAHPGRRVVWLQVACRREFSERIARAPARFGGLPRAQLAAVPHDGGLCAAGGGFGGYARDRCLPARGERPPRVDIRADRLAVVNEKQLHAVMECAPWVRAGTLVRRRES